MRTSSDITERIKAIDNHFGDALYEQITDINEAVLTNTERLDRVNTFEFLEQAEQNSALTKDERTMLISYFNVNIQKRLKVLPTLKLTSLGTF